MVLGSCERNIGLSMVPSTWILVGERLIKQNLLEPSCSLFFMHLTGQGRSWIIDYWWWEEERSHSTTPLMSCWRVSESAPVHTTIQVLIINNTYLSCSSQYHRHCVGRPLTFHDNETSNNVEFVKRLSLVLHGLTTDRLHPADETNHSLTNNNQHLMIHRDRFT